MKLATDEKIIKKYVFGSTELSITTDRLIIDEKLVSNMHSGNTATITNQFSSRQYPLKDIYNINIDKKEITKTTNSQIVTENSSSGSAVALFFGALLLILGVAMGIAINPLLFFAAGIGLIMIIGALMSKKPTNTVRTETQKNNTVKTEFKIFTYQNIESPIFSVRINDDSVDLLENIFPMILDIQKDKKSAIKKWTDVPVTEEDIDK